MKTGARRLRSGLIDDSTRDISLKNTLPHNERARRVFRCDSCQASTRLPCSVHTSVIVDNNYTPRAFVTCPKELCILDITIGVKGVFTTTSLKSSVIFGPLVGDLSEFPDEPAEYEYSVTQTPDGATRFYRLDSDDTCNWMKFVRRASPDQEGNVIAYQDNEQIYFATTGPLSSGTELRVEQTDKVSENVDPSSAPTFLNQSVAFPAAPSFPTVSCLPEFPVGPALSPEAVQLAVDSSDLDPLDPLFNFLPTDADVPAPMPIEKKTCVSRVYQSDILCRHCRGDLITKITNESGKVWTCNACAPSGKPEFPAWGTAKRHITSCHRDGLCLTCRDPSALSVTVSADSSGSPPTVTSKAIQYAIQFPPKPARKRRASSGRPGPAKKSTILKWEKASEEAVLQAVIDANPYQLPGSTRSSQRIWREVYDRLMVAGDILPGDDAKMGMRKLRRLVRFRVKRYEAFIKSRKSSPETTPRPESRMDSIVVQVGDLIRLQAAGQAAEKSHRPGVQCVYRHAVSSTKEELKEHRQTEHFSKGAPRKHRRNPQSRKHFQERFLPEILQAVVAGRPFDSFPHSTGARKAWMDIFNQLITAGHYPAPDSPGRFFQHISDFRKFIRELVDQHIYSGATHADGRVSELIQQVYELMQNEPTTGKPGDRLAPDFVDERLQTVVDNNPYQFRRFSLPARAAWMDVREELVAAGHLRSNSNVERDCWQIRTFVQLLIDDFRKAATAGALDLELQRNQLIKKVSDLMKIPASLQPPQEPFIEEKLQAVVDANPYRFLDPNSAHAVWASIWEGLVALKYIPADSGYTWRSLRNCMLHVAMPRKWSAISGANAAGAVASRKNDLIQRVFTQMRQREADQLAQSGVEAFLCLRCVRRFNTPAALELHQEETHEAAVPKIGRGKRKRKTDAAVIGDEADGLGSVPMEQNESLNSSRRVVATCNK